MGSRYGRGVNPFLATKARPLVVGHRGAPRYHQENTLASFRRAAALGVPAVELDVVASADGVPVVFHDAEVDRLTDGHGRVDRLPWDRLARLRLRRELTYVGADGAPVVMRYARAEPIARLDEVLAELDPRVAINVEVKIGLPRWWRTEVAVQVAAAITAAGAADRVIVTSFDPRKLRAVRRAAPAVDTGFCFDDTMLDFAGPLLDRLPPLTGRLVHTRRNPLLALEWILAAHLVGRALPSRVVGAEHTLIGPHTVASLRHRGIAVGTHTLFPLTSPTTKPPAAAAFTDAEVARLAACGVDWIETDDPERVMALLR